MRPVCGAGGRAAESAPSGVTRRADADPRRPPSVAPPVVGTYGCSVITVVLGAPGSGKSTVIEPLTALLPGHVLLDWDAFMHPAAALAGRDIRLHPETWPAYRELVQTVAMSVATVPVVLLGGATPDELERLPASAWVVLDCSDEERRQRLHAGGRDHDIGSAIADAQDYRSLGLPVIDSTARPPAVVAADVASFVVEAERR